MKHYKIYGAHFFKIEFIPQRDATSVSHGVNSTRQSAKWYEKAD